MARSTMKCPYTNINIEDEWKKQCLHMIDGKNLTHMKCHDGEYITIHYAEHGEVVIAGIHTAERFWKLVALWEGK